MKNKSFLLTLAASLILFTASAHTDTYKVDAKESHLVWSGKKMTGQHWGTINISGGQLQDTHGTVTGKVEVDMTSLQDTDLTGSYKAKLEGHLKSADFFEVDKYPTSVLTVTSITPLEKGKDGINTHTVKGTMTIKNHTNPIEFNVAKKDIDATHIRYSGQLIIDRSKYDVRYGSKTFFADIGDKMVYDDFTLIFNLALIKE